MRRSRAVRVFTPGAAPARRASFTYPGIPESGDAAAGRLATGSLAGLVHLGVFGFLLAFASAPAQEKPVPIWLLRELASVPLPPEPEPVLVAEAPKIALPKPEPEPEVEPEPRPEPAKQPVKPEPPPAPRELVKIEPIARPAPLPPERIARREPPKAPPEPPRVRPDLAPLPAPEELAAVAPERAQRRSPLAMDPLNGPRPALGIDALPGAPASLREPALATRRPPAALAQAARNSAPRPELALPAAPAPEAPRLDAPPSPARAPAAAPPAPARPRVTAHALAPAALPQPPAAPRGVARAPAPRSAPPPAPPAPAARGREHDLSGVPLGSLAACVTDREEDALKRRLVAVVGERQECASDAGRYRFVEAKNLNAFLMWVERAPGRAQADRCVELTLALDCVARQGRRAQARAR